LPPFLVQGANEMSEDTLDRYVQGVVGLVKGF
jgi:glutathione-regulated potassium-efflux system ancillary protein KefG